MIKIQITKTKGILWALLALAIIVGAVSLVLVRQQPEPEPIKIGAILPLTGPLSGGGQRLLYGIELAVDEVNARGGVNGRLLEIVVEDGALNKDIERRAFASIEERTEPLFYLVQADIFTGEISALAQESEVVLLQLVIADFENAKGTFQYGIDVKQQNEPVLELMRKLDVETVGLLHSVAFAYTDEKIDQFKETLEAQGRILQGNESIGFGQTDYTDQINALEGTDAIYFVGLNQNVPRIVEQARTLGYMGYIFTIPLWYQEIASELPPGEVVYLSAPAIFNPNFLLAQEVAERYTDTQLVTPSLLMSTLALATTRSI